MREVLIFNDGIAAHQSELYRLHAKSIMNEYSDDYMINIVGRALSSPTSIKLLKFLSQWRTYKDISSYMGINVEYARVLMQTLSDAHLIKKAPYKRDKSKIMIKLKYDRLIINLDD